MIKVCLNAGHKPGMDPGALGLKSTEAELALKFATKAAEYLRAVGYNVLVVQENELEDIVEASDNFDADVFLSIHMNSAVAKAAYGTETFYSVNSSKGKKLASCVQKQVEAFMVEKRIEQRPDISEDTVRDYSDRGLKTNSLYVVRNTNAPAALLEIGFISNELDEEILINNIDSISAAIARGVSDYFA